MCGPARERKSLFAPVSEQKKNSLSSSCRRRARAHASANCLPGVKTGIVVCPALAAKRMRQTGGEVRFLLGTTSMNRKQFALFCFSAMAGLLLAGQEQAFGASGGELRIARARGTEIIPEASRVQPDQAATRAHTNIRLFVPRGASRAILAPFGNYETPASLACVYGVTKRKLSCNPTKALTAPSGGSRAIAIVDAYDNPSALSDLNVFSATFGLPAADAQNFRVVYASGQRPDIDITGGWEAEESLDVQVAHALAPSAKIILVEAASPDFADLTNAVQLATKLLASEGGGELSMSWGFGESHAADSFARYYGHANVVAFSSAGDASGSEFPAVLTNVIGVGGTTILRDANGNYLGQSAWADTGGGSSIYLSRPAFQDAVASAVGTMRGTPDTALLADPQSGLWIYDTNPYDGAIRDWLVAGGTSLSAPATAAIVNNAGHFLASTGAELSLIYASRNKRAAFTDITTGTCGNPTYDSPATAGWDFCTGIGTPLGLQDK
jgi:hypothetical protein